MTSVGPLVSTAARMVGISWVLTAVGYPLLVTGMAQLLMPQRATGSLVQDEHGQQVGSELLGQSFSQAAYVHPRPSMAGAGGYDPLASSGPSEASSSPQLRDRLRKTSEHLKKTHPQATGPVPMDLLTASASGLDPHISPEAAYWQASRVAVARGVQEERIRKVIQSLVEPPDLGLIGQARVNVLLLNLALDRLLGPPEVGLQPEGLQPEGLQPGL